MQAGLTVAKSVGKGPYFAHKVQSLVTYIKRFQCLPPNNVGKHHVHPSLLNDEQIYQAVHQYLAVQPVGEVSQSSTQCILAGSKSFIHHPAVSCRSLP